MSSLIKGNIMLVGAGPGDPELLTIKGYKAIAAADILFYDALVNPEILQINSKAEKVFVGKRLGNHKYNQKEINQLLVEAALHGKRVVRLKGGDCMVFGRAHEELQAAKWHGIDTQVVPGISSYAGIAASNKIPLTVRCEQESFWVTTGFTCKGEISKDIPLAAQSSATIIVLMGMSKLETIVQEFAKYKPQNYPVAIVQNGTTTKERSILGTLENILELVKKHKISNPANIIFGYSVISDVVEFVNNLNYSQVEEEKVQHAAWNG